MMDEIIKAQHKGVFSEMSGASEEPRATRALNTLNTEH